MGEPPGVASWKVWNFISMSFMKSRHHQDVASSSYVAMLNFPSPMDMRTRKTPYKSVVVVLKAEHSTVKQGAE